jgi:hypothetical protein
MAIRFSREERNKRALERQASLLKEQRQKEGEKLIAYVSDKALRKELKRRSLLEKEPRSHS